MSSPGALPPSGPMAIASTNGWFNRPSGDTVPTGADTGGAGDKTGSDEECAHHVGNLGTTDGVVAEGAVEVVDPLSNMDSIRQALPEVEKSTTATAT